MITKGEGQDEFDIAAFTSNQEQHQVPPSPPSKNPMAKLGGQLLERLHIHPKGTSTTTESKKESKRESQKESEKESKKEEKDTPPSSSSSSSSKLMSPEALAARGFKPLVEGDVAQYLTNHKEVAGRLGGTPAEWKVEEVGDGNLNYVYIVKGSSGAVVLKQALPYVRCVGESWPMTLERAFFETSALREHGALCPGRVPEVYAFDHPMAVTLMQYIAPPHIILRKGLIQGVVYPHLAKHVGEYMATTLFKTSLLALSTEQHRAAVAKYCGNVEMCRLTEQVIFTDPYCGAENNRWTTPELDSDAKAVREDEGCKLAIAELKAK